MKGEINMGLMDNLRVFFSGSKNTKNEQVQVNDEFEKTKLAARIVDLVDKIKRLNSLDRSVWNLRNITNYELERKSLSELQRLKSTLENRLLELNEQIQKANLTMESLEAAKWTGRKPKNMSDHDFDRLQRDEGR